MQCFDLSGGASGTEPSAHQWAVGMGATLLVLIPFLVVSMRLSALHQDLSRLPLLAPTSSAGVVQTHLLRAWTDCHVPATGPFTPDANGSGSFLTSQTAAKVRRSPPQVP